MRILILCTGNSCRSQMAEYILRSLDPALEVYSAGTKPAPRGHPNAIKAMKELGIDLNGAFPKNVDRFINESFDYVITVCDNAKETCPAFVGKVRHRIHMGFEDPAEAMGTEDEVLAVFRRVRDEINSSLRNFYFTELSTSKQRGPR